MLDHQLIDEALDAYIDPGRKKYFQFHKKRYRHLLNHISSMKSTADSSEPFNILDVGPSHQTALIRSIWPDIKVNTLGYQIKPNVLRPYEQHWHLNLNEVDAFVDDLGSYDLIILAEVIEHLYTQPQIIFRFLHSALKEKGKIIIQTPNAVALFKRIQMVLGKNPYEQLRVDREGHFREYTADELKAILTESGYQVTSTRRHNYFAYHEYWYQILYNYLTKWAPEMLRDGITMIAQK
jgi:hypothetical protein